jgi:hypothetical protein
VDRIAKKDFDVDTHYLHGPQDTFMETPVLVENVLDPSTCEEMCDVLFRANLDVDIQRKHKASTDIYHVTLEQGIDAVMASTHDDSRLIFEEGLLDRDASLQSISERLTDARESLFTDEDWLAHFPTKVEPTSCVVIAGEGATSTLHRDPLEWTGTSLCLEGTKVWRFISPIPNVAAIDKALASYRLNSIAWGEHEVPISSGWQSNFNLFDKRDNDIPSAREFDEMEPNEKWKKMQEIAADVSMSLQPNANISELWTVVQKPGDLLIIPAYWWHQTYALEPSIAVASQRCGTKRDAPRLVRHILETSGLIHDAKTVKGVQRDSYENSAESPREIVNKLFTELIAALR